MGQLSRGDRISIRLKDDYIVAPSDAYDEVQIFEIISSDNYGYYLYVPHYLHLNTFSIADANRCAKLDIDLRFKDEKIIYVAANLVAGIVSYIDGMTCSHCLDFFEMTIPNCPDGKFLCRACRENPWR